MRSKRTDQNHADVRDALRKCGWTVLDCSGCPGLVDVLAHRRGVLRMIEIKRDAKAKLTPRQAALIAEGWPIVIIRDVNEAARLR